MCNVKMVNSRHSRSPFTHQMRESEFKTSRSNCGMPEDFEFRILCEFLLSK